MKKLIHLLMMMLLLTSIAPLARAASSDTPDTPAGSTIDVDDRRGEAESDLYAEGTDAIDEEEWSRAIDVFKRVVAMKGKRVDGALYWLAYAQHKAGRGGEALKTIDALERAHPQSRWIKDAKALELDIKRSSGQRVDPSKVDDEELKLIVIQGLMSSDPERALPLLQKIVEGPYSKHVKEQALFVLSQSPSPRAAQLIASIARGAAHAELQSDAIKYLGISGQRNLKLLGEVYQSTANGEVKKEILRAYMLAGAKQPLFTAARSEKDPNLRATAVRTLGLMGGERTGATLVQMYRGESDAQVRRAALEGLFVQGNARALVELAKSEKDPRWKREIVQKLAVMNSKDAADYLTDLLKD